MGNKQVETKLNPAQRACTGEPNQQTKQEDHQTELLFKYFNRPKMDDQEDSTDNDAAAVAIAADATNAAAVAGAADATDTVADSVPMAADATNVNAVAMATVDVGDDLVDTDDDDDKDESAEVSRPQTI